MVAAICFLFLQRRDLSPGGSGVVAYLDEIKQSTQQLFNISDGAGHDGNYAVSD